jgi:hypothetical protein
MAVKPGIIIIFKLVGIGACRCQSAESGGRMDDGIGGRRAQDRLGGRSGINSEYAVRAPGAPQAGSIAGSDMPVIGFLRHGRRLVSECRLYCGGVNASGKGAICGVLELIGIGANGCQPAEGGGYIYKGIIGW